MRLTGALIREQGADFAVVIVQSHVVHSRSEAERALLALRPLFPRVPIVLMAQDSRGIPTYVGRPDLTRFMASVPMQAVPWREFSVS